MSWHERHTPRCRAVTTLLLAFGLAALPLHSALGLITGGEGNQPLETQGWPQGTAPIFNHPARVAWWEGPPFGGGEWHAECRGDAQALSAVLADFAKLDVKAKRVVLRDGVGRSFWLNPNRKPEKQDAAKIDWTFMVWQAANWQRLQKSPAESKPRDLGDADNGPPAQIEVFTGGNIRWSEVTVPAGLKVEDQRLEAHGFTPADGAVLQGQVHSSDTRQPLSAKVRLERTSPQQHGMFEHTTLAEAATDAKGRWLFKNAPAGASRIVVEADGFVPRIVAYLGGLDDEPRWSSHDCHLSRPGTVSGRVTNDAGQPLADVSVRFSDVVDASGSRYEAPYNYACKTDADGRFRFEQLPVGRLTVWLHKRGYCRPGLGEKLAVPAADIALQMFQAARIVVTVDFAKKKRPDQYIVEINPPGGPVVGSWGGSAMIDAKNQFTFSEVPPGRYVLVGRPNPGAEKEQTSPLTIDVKSGQVLEVELPAK